MEHTKIDSINLQSLDQWFANLVDTLNYNIGLINSATGLLTTGLTTVDVSPITDVKDTLNKLVENINTGFQGIMTELSHMDTRIKTLGG